MDKTYRVTFIEEIDGESVDRTLLVTKVDPNISPDVLKDYIKLLIFSKYTYSDYKKFKIKKIEEI